MKRIFQLTILLAALASAGCVGLPTPPRLGASDPASPSAPEAAFFPTAPLLMTGNNYAMSTEGEGQPMEMDMKMDMKGMKMDMKDMPEHGGKPMKAPEHEGHEKPPATPNGHEHHQDNAPKQ